MSLKNPQDVIFEDFPDSEATDLIPTSLKNGNKNLKGEKMKNPIEEELLKMLDKALQETNFEEFEFLRKEEPPKVDKGYKFFGCISKCVEEHGKLPSEVFKDDT